MLDEGTHSIGINGVTEAVTKRVFGAFVPPLYERPAGQFQGRALREIGIEQRGCRKPSEENGCEAQTYYSMITFALPSFTWCRERHSGAGCAVVRADNLKLQPVLTPLQQQHN